MSTPGDRTKEKVSDLVRGILAVAEQLPKQEPYGKLFGYASGVIELEKRLAELERKNTELGAWKLKTHDYDAILNLLQERSSSEPRGDLWSAQSANDGMRHMEESDISGGLTDSEPRKLQPSFHSLVLREFASNLQYWIDCYERRGDDVTDETLVIAPPSWPTVGMLKTWIKALKGESLETKDVYYTDHDGEGFILRRDGDDDETDEQPSTLVCVTCLTEFAQSIAGGLCPKCSQLNTVPAETRVVQISATDEWCPVINATHTFVAGECTHCRCAQNTKGDA